MSRCVDLASKLYMRHMVVLFDAVPKSVISDVLERTVTVVDPDAGHAEFTRNAAGYVTRVEETGMPAVELGYDALGRVSSVSMTGPGGACTYDAAGNVTRIECDGRPTLDLEWNGQYQLVSVSTNGVFAEGYAYDAIGRRASTTTLAGTTRHVKYDKWHVVADLDEQNNVVASYTWGDGIGQASRGQGRRRFVLSAGRHTGNGLGLRRLAEQRRRPLAVRRLGQRRR